MNRREALSKVALLLGGTIVGAEVFLSGCNPDKKYGASGLNFSADDISFLDEVGETIIPATSTPGAKEAKVGEFMKTIVSDCYEQNEQQVFIAGMQQLDDACKKKNGKSFLACDAAQRHDLLVELDKEAKEHQQKKMAFDKIQGERQVSEKQKGSPGFKKEEMPSHYFRLMKELTLWGFFTSQPGATKALRYIAVPGRYDGCVPYKKGDKAWAT